MADSTGFEWIIEAAKALGVATGLVAVVGGASFLFISVLQFISALF